jgi:hypothetical protein
MRTSSEAYDGTPQYRCAAKLSWLLWMAVAAMRQRVDPQHQSQ